MHSALQAPLLLPRAPDLPHSCSLRDGKGTGEGAGICRRGKGQLWFPRFPLPDGGLITARPPVHPDCTWGLRRRCGDLCTGPFPGTDDGFHLALPAHSPPSLGPACGSWAPQARPAPFSGLHLAPAAIQAQTAGKAAPLSLMQARAGLHLQPSPAEGQAPVSIPPTGRSRRLGPPSPELQVLPLSCYSLDRVQVGERRAHLSSHR